MPSCPKIVNTCNDWLIGETVVRTGCGIMVWEARVPDLEFASDVLIFAETLEVLLHTLDTLNMKSKSPSVCAEEQK